MNQQQYERKDWVLTVKSSFSLRLRTVAFCTALVFGCGQIIFAAGENPYEQYQVRPIQPSADVSDDAGQTPAPAPAPNTSLDFLNGGNSPLSPVDQTQQTSQQPPASPLAAASSITWIPAPSNPNYVVTAVFWNGLWYAGVKKKNAPDSTASIFATSATGNFQNVFDISPDGSTIFYGIDNTIYAQRIADPTQKLSTAGRYTAISFEDSWAKLSWVTSGVSYTAWLNIQTAEVRMTDPITPPAGFVKINNGATYTTSRNVTMNLSVSSGGSTLSQMRFSVNGGASWTAWEAYSTVKTGTLSPGDGTREIRCQVSDTAGNISTFLDTIILDTAAPTGSVNINSGAAYSTSPTVTLNLSAVDATSGINKMSFSTDNVNWTTPEAYATSKVGTLPSGDGAKTVYVRYYDKAGNISATYSKSIVLDQTAPAGSILINGGAASTGSRNVTLNLTGSDVTSGLDQMRFSVDGGANWTTWEDFALAKSLELPEGDGDKTILYELRDKVGNVDCFSDGITLDTTAPSGAVVINGGANYTNNASVTLTLNASDATSGLDQMRFSADNGITWTEWEDFALAKSLELSGSDGEKTIQYQVKDKAGNASEIISDSIILDTTSPSGSALINDGASYTNEPEVKVTVDALDNLGPVEVSFSQDGVNFSLETIYVPSDGTHPFYRITFDGADGEKVLFIRLRDEAGNITTFSQKIILERTPPYGSIALDGYPSNNYFYDFPVTLNLNAADAESGVSSMRFSLDGGTLWTDWESYQTTRTISLEEARSLYDYTGTNNVVFSVEYKDLAGNVKQESFSSIRDGELPQGTLLINGGAQYTNNREVALSLTAYDNISGVRGIQIRILNQDGSIYSDTGLIPFEPAKTVTLPEGDGEKRVLYSVCDQVSCIYQSDTIILDTTLPAGSLDINNGEPYTTTTSVTLTLTGSDATSGLDQMRFSADNGITWTEWEDFALAKSLELSGSDGEKTIQYQVKDKAGNTATFNDTVILDRVAPTGTVVINNGNAYTTDPAVILTLAIINAALMRFSTDSGVTWTEWETFATTKSLTFADLDGTQTVQCQFQNVAGSVNGFNDTIILDRVAPTGTVVINNGEPYTTTTSVTLTLTGSDATSGLDQMRFSADNGITWTEWEDFALAKSLELSGSDGEKTIQYQVKDKAGNTATFNDTVILDRVAPTGTVVINNGEPYTTTTSVTLTLTGSDATSGLDQMRFYNGSTWTSWQSFSGTASVTLPSADGTKTVRAQFKDAAGNIATFSDTIVLDRYAPSGTFSINNNSTYTNSASIQLNLSVLDVVSGIKWVGFSTDGISYYAYGDYNLPKSLQLSAGDGTRTIYVWVEDWAGNKVILNDSIILDTVAPTGSVAINNGMARTGTSLVNLSLTGSDLTSGVEVMSFSTDEGNAWSDWESFSTSKTLSFSSGDGEKEVQVRLKDEAGNISDIISDTIILDSTILLLADQNLKTNKDIRKTMILGSLLDGGGNALTYSFSAESILLANGQFSLLQNQLTYTPNSGFTGTGVITIQFSNGASITQYNINLQVAAPVVNTPNDTYLSYQYGLTLTQAIRAWNLSSGSGVAVAVIDTGINMSHPDLSGNIFTNLGEIAGDGIDNDGNGFVDDVHGWDFVNLDNNPSDDNGHGTHVAGIIAAQSNNGQGVSGIAPDVKLVPVKVLNSSGGGLSIDSAFQKVAQGILYAVSVGARVISMSLGYWTSEISASVVQAIQNAITTARAAGVVVVAASGNDYSDVALVTPAALSGVITVAATNSSNVRATFSNYGEEVELAAPGVSVYSALWSSTNPSTYGYMSGTSMAAPFVSGLSAMILAQDPTATDVDVLRRMKFSAKDLGTSGFDNYYGYGRIDAFKALSYDYYDNGTIKTQWLEEADENGWNRLSFNTNGYLTGGTFTAASGFAGLSTALTDAIALAPRSSVSFPLSFSPTLAIKRFLVFKRIDSWSSWTGLQQKKAEKENVSEMPRSPLLLSANKEKSDEVQKNTSKESKKNSSPRRLFVRDEVRDQKIVSTSVQEKLVLKSIWGSPLSGAALCLLDA